MPAWASSRLASSSQMPPLSTFTRCRYSTSLQIQWIWCLPACKTRYFDLLDRFMSDRTSCDQWEDENRRLLIALIATNTAVFGMWKVAQRHPGLAKFMWTHFACSFHGVASEKRVHTLLTSAFSHQTPLHFGINMFMLWHFGSAVLPPTDHRSPFRRQSISDASWFKSVVKQFHYAVHEPRSLNSREFTKLYFTSAIASSVLSAVVSGLRGMGHVYSIGASGAVFGILTTYCLMHPDRELLLYGMLPLSADEMLKLSVLINGIGSVMQHAKHRALSAVVPSVDFVGHLGGQAAAYAIVPK
ncbi:hypothetical protein, variant 3 [Aphanomyces invadans]|uniref:Peptidase S54 rhomboid domain-containing protein n=1 Tax=Aphanomyces invadans TaxID=157072 RepID=A0A024UUY5_9STRA|nr:hypothetical protein, variant 3 [Aphanomyces invadans]ETW09770.1 hypothetical protein, variant 3 [Aphanomyces invadans]|eukprot:XP_008861179.1 hypothetical protein, variant 3 [Aphanomyces invadans]